MNGEQNYINLLPFLQLILRSHNPGNVAVTKMITWAQNAVDASCFGIGTVNRKTVLREGNVVTCCVRMQEKL